MNKYLTRIDEELISNYCRSRDETIEYILRNKIDNPIKGEITKDKIRWRGIKNLCYCEGEFIGVEQRDKVVGVNGVINFKKRL